MLVTLNDLKHMAYNVPHALRKTTEETFVTQSFFWCVQKNYLSEHPLIIFKNFSAASYEQSSLKYILKFESS